MQPSCPPTGRELCRERRSQTPISDPSFRSSPNSKFREGSLRLQILATSATAMELEEIFYAEPHICAEQHTGEGPHCGTAFPVHFATLRRRRYCAGRHCSRYTLASRRCCRLLRGR